MVSLKIDLHLNLELLQKDHAQVLYQLASANKLYLSEWLSWLPYISLSVSSGYKRKLLRS